MKALINRQTLINAFCSQCTVDKPETCSTIQYGDKWCNEVYTILNTPTVDAVQVVECDDCISRQAALDSLRKDPMGGLNYESILGSLPPAQQRKREQDDLISRQAAIDTLAEWHDDAITNRLNNLPSIDAVPVRHGR